MNLMRGPQQEEPQETTKEEEKPHLRMLPALPATDEPAGQMQAFGLDITKEEGGQ